MTTSSGAHGVTHGGIDARIEKIDHAIEHAAHYLPAQGPIEVFVHHNTLHAYQHLPFHEALAAAEEKVGGRGYLAESEYRRHYERGRITARDLAAALTDMPPPPLPRMPGLPDAAELAHLILVHGIEPTTQADLRFRVCELDQSVQFAKGVSDAARTRILDSTRTFIESRPREVEDETRALFGLEANSQLALAVGRQVERRPLLDCFNAHPEAFSVHSLYRAALDRCAGHSRPVEPYVHRIKFPRDMLLRVHVEDTNDLVHPVLIPLCGAFLDRGQSRWSMPDRDQGMYVAWSRFETTGKAVRASWLSSLGNRLRSQRALGWDAHQVVVHALEELGIADSEIEDFITHELLLLPGWAGMFHRLETAPGPIGRSATKVRLIDYLAVRLTLDVLAIADKARKHGITGPVDQLRDQLRPQLQERTSRPSDAELAWPLFLLAQHAGLGGSELRALDDRALGQLLDWLAAFDQRQREIRWHEAYERNYATEIFDALSVAVVDRGEVERPQVQMVTCIDDRCESIRRHIEEQSTRFETFGAAGFFNLAIAYQGVDDPSAFPLCPVVVNPQHRIVERVKEEHADRAERRRVWMRRWGKLDAAFTRASSSLLWAPVVTTATGFAAALPLLGSVFAPRMTADVRRRAKGSFIPDLETTITTEREEKDRVEGEELYDGFDLDEQAARVGTLLENMGVVKSFAPIVAIVGHDSSSSNNPHVAAYSCGACGGRSGGPNARLFARMANRPEVRARLLKRGIVIPADTHFVGGVQDTAADAFHFYDLDQVPVERREDLARYFDALELARRKDAHERCRRFFSAPRNPSLQQALHHVEERTHSLGQARPELGHATNASCIVGRRSVSRGVFLDRRAFLVSYDPTIDPDGKILERILLAVGPVGAGINLEYYFSTVDNEKWGAGTKLPHNVTGLFGVMNGANSDLRTGLPKQMIEIHEPVRLHLVCETTPAVLTAIVERQPSVAELVVNEWIRVAAVDPTDGSIHVFDAKHGFRPFVPSGRPLPHVQKSEEQYQGHVSFVPPALIAANRPVRDGGRS